MKKILIVNIFILAALSLFANNIGCSASESKSTDVIEVDIRSDSSAEQIEKLRNDIQAMPEVKEIIYVSKEESLRILREEMKGHEEVLDSLSGNPMPAYYEITVNDSSLIEEIASRFYSHPLAYNTPGTHDGVIIRAKRGS